MRTSPKQVFPVEWCNSFFHVHSRKTAISNHLLSPILLLLRQNHPVLGSGLHQYQVWKILLRAGNWSKAILARLPGNLSATQMQLVVPVANKTVLSSYTVCSGAQQKWKIQGWTFFYSQQDQGSFEALSQSVVMVMFWQLVFILSDETTWPRKVTSLLRKWHLVGFSFKPAVLCITIKHLP